MEHFGEFLRKERILSKLTQQELADGLSVDRSLISQWERGLCEPNIDTLRKLCVILSLSGDDILQLNEPNKYFGRKRKSNTN